MEGNTNRFIANPWLEFTGWEEHIWKCVRQELIDSIQPAAGEEPEEQQGQQQRQRWRQQQLDQFVERKGDEGLADACKATRRLIRQAFQICRSNVIGRSALEYINRQEVGERSNERPFYAKHKVQTIRKYSNHWAKIL